MRRLQDAARERLEKQRQEEIAAGLRPAVPEPQPDPDVRGMIADPDVTGYESEEEERQRQLEEQRQKQAVLQAEAQAQEVSMRSTFVTQDTGDENSEQQQQQQQQQQQSIPADSVPSGDVSTDTTTAKQTAEPVDRSAKYPPLQWPPARDPESDPSSVATRVPLTEYRPVKTGGKGVRIQIVESTAENQQTQPAPSQTAGVTVAAIDDNDVPPLDDVDIQPGSLSDTSQTTQINANEDTTTAGSEETGDDAIPAVPADMESLD